MEDYNIKASKIKSLIRHWRAKGVSPGDTMKLMMLYLGTDRFLNSELVYDRSQFNRIRKDLGFRTIPALLDIIRKSQSFLIVHSRQDDAVIAVVSPALHFTMALDKGDMYVETVADSDQSVANSDGTYLKLNNTSKDVYSLNTSLDNSLNKLTRQRPIEKPLPKLDKRYYYEDPLPLAVKRVDDYFEKLYMNRKLMNTLLEPLLFELFIRFTPDGNEVFEIAKAYLEDRVKPVFARRKGIENWTTSQIDAWLKSRHQPKLARVKYTEAVHNWQVKHPDEDIDQTPEKVLPF